MKCRFRKSKTITDSARANCLAPLLTVPCILDICGIYGTLSDPFAEGAQKIISEAVRLRPALLNELARGSELIAENILDVIDACSAAIVDVNDSTSTPDESLTKAMQDVADGIVYLRDASLTICTLLSVYPRASECFLKYGPCLVESLGSLHDELIPKLLVKFSRQQHDAFSPEKKNIGFWRQRIEKVSLHVELATEKAVELLLVHAFMDSKSSWGCEEDTGGMGSSSSSSISNRQSSARGEGLIHCLTVLGHREGQHTTMNRANNMNLASALSHRHSLAGKIAMALQSKIITLDDAQADYIAALLDVPDLKAAPTPLPGKDNLHETNETIPYTKSAAMSNIEVKEENMEHVKILSEVSQVRDLLPDLGEGYIASCLDEFNHEMEATINALLEDSVPQKLKKLDKKMSFEEYQNDKWSNAAAALAQKNQVGKNIRSSTTGSIWGQGLVQPPLHPESNSQKIKQKHRADELTAKFLDAKDSDFRQKLIAAATEMQWEYEDEYDDSFDDLIPTGVDVVAETEQLVNSLSKISLTSSGVEPSNVMGESISGEKYDAKKAGSIKGPSKKWILDGRVYNYPKPGAKEVSERKPSAGNSLNMDSPLDSREQKDRSDTDNALRDGTGREKGRGRGRGRSHHSVSESRERRRKDVNKSSIANHSRKDRAAQKMSRGMN